VEVQRSLAAHLCTRFRCYGPLVTILANQSVDWIRKAD